MVPRRPEWDAFTKRTLTELREADELFRPTSFWGPGLERLLGDLDSRGLDTFKSWPTAGDWFYPRYGADLTNALIDGVIGTLGQRLPNLNVGFVRGALTASHEANRDFDVARMFWDTQRWPMDLDAYGESMVGKPKQYFRMHGGDVGWTRPMLNYTLCMAALSHHVDGPPRRFLEIGGGYGSLGEFVMSHDPEAVYVNLDIPPLLTVSTWYLQELFGERVSGYAGMPSTGAIELPGSGVLPNYRLPDLVGSYDVFVNTFSFQEMEPHVVRSYVDLVSNLGITHVVSLNSLLGKPKKSDGHAIGVVDPVTSARIIEMFEQKGFTLCATYDRPIIRSAGQIAVLRRG